jgi:hypothetical protein
MKQQTLGAALVGMALALPFSASANLIQNGGFETPPTQPPFQYRTGTDINNWIISSTHKGVAQFDSTYRPVGGGDYSIQIESGGLSPDSISQTVNSLMLGQQYTVSFLLSAYDAGGASLDVSIDGVTQNFTSFSQSYASHSFTFVATGTSETLTFKNAGDYAVSYPQIDNVSLVPEPTTMIAGALLGLPFGASTLRTLRKRRTA